jgi:hypothetical protein
MPERRRKKNNYLFDDKKVKLFINGFFSRTKNSRFIKSAGRGWVGALFLETMKKSKKKTQ